MEPADELFTAATKILASDNWIGPKDPLWRELRTATDNYRNARYPKVPQTKPSTPQPTGCMCDHTQFGGIDIVFWDKDCPLHGITRVRT